MLEIVIIKLGLKIILLGIHFRLGFKEEAFVWATNCIYLLMHERRHSLTIWIFVC